jgi:23S rRNA pseudouridine1911/1915/1917 synthase
MREYKVTEEAGNRIDKEISAFDKTLTRVATQRMIENGNILVNGNKVKPSYKLNKGDKITVEEEDPIMTHIKPQEIPLDVVYEDNDILVINKEKGMVVHPGNGNQEGTLVNAVMAKCKESLSGIGGEIRPGIIHRLDKDTSRTYNRCQK